MSNGKFEQEPASGSAIEEAFQHFVAQAEAAHQLQKVRALQFVFKHQFSELELMVCHRLRRSGPESLMALVQDLLDRAQQVPEESVNELGDYFQLLQVLLEMAKAQIEEQAA